MKAEYKEQYKDTLRLALPVCLGQLGHMLVGITDSIMVGNFGGEGSNIGTLSLAAASLANGFYTVVLVFGIGVSYGVTPMVASSRADQTEDRVQYLRHSILLGLVAGVSLFGLLFFTAPLLYHFGQKPEVVELAIPFFRIMILSMIPLMVFLSLKQFTEGLSFTIYATAISLGANVLNAILNYILIYGKAGLPAMGLTGSGWASFTSRVAMVIAMIAYVYFSPAFRSYRPGFSFKQYSYPLLKKLLSIGIPVGFQFVFEVGAFAFAAVMIGWISEKHLAAHQIAISLAAVTFMLASGLSAAATVKVGNRLGDQDKKRLRIAGHSALHLVIILMGAAALTFIIFRNLLPSFFNQDPEVISIAGGLLIIAALFQLSDGLQVVGQGILRGMSDVKVPTLFALLAYWAIGLPVGYLLLKYTSLGAQGMWVGLMAGLTVAAVLMIRRFNRLTARLPEKIVNFIDTTELK